MLLHFYKFLMCLGIKEYETANEYIDLALNQNPNDLTLLISKYLILANLDNINSISYFEDIKLENIDNCQLIQLYYLYYGTSLEFLANMMKQ